MVKNLPAVQETWVQYLDWQDPLGKGTGTHSSIFDKHIYKTVPSFSYLPDHYPDSLVGKESTCNAGDLGLILRLGNSSREGNGSPLYYTGLESSMDRGAWQATVHGVIKSRA